MEENLRINLKTKFNSVNLFATKNKKRLAKKKTLLLSSDLINKDLFLNEEENSYENFVYVAMKPSKERNAKDLLVIKRRIINTDFYQKIKTENLDEIALERVLLFCSLNLYYKNFWEDDFIYKEGEKIEDYLIVFKGKMKLVKPVTSLKSMNLEEYLYFLRDLDQKNLTELFEKTTRENKISFDLHDVSIEEIDEILFRMKLIKLTSKRVEFNDFDKLFKNSIKEPQQFQIDLIELKKCEENSKQDMIDYLEVLIPNHLNYKILTTFKSYEEIENTKKGLILYSYQELSIIGDGQFLGETDVREKEDIKNHSARVTEDIHLGYIDKYQYKDFVNLELYKMKLKENMFIIDNFMFQSIKPGSFKKKFFHEFNLQEYQRGKLLFKENDYPDYVYFTKEGEVDLTLKMSVLELNSLINSLKTKLNSHDLIKEEYQLQNDPNYEELNRKQIFHLFIFGSKRVLGLNEFFHNFPTFYEAIVISEKAKLYKLETNVLRRILSEEKQSQVPFQKYVKTNMTSVLNRLIEIKSAFLRIYDKKMNFEDRVKRLHNKNLLMYKSNNSPNNSQIFISSEIYQNKCEQHRKNRNDTQNSKSVSIFKTSLDFEQFNNRKNFSKNKNLETHENYLPTGTNSKIRSKFINTFNLNSNKNEDFLIEKKVRTYLKSEISNNTVNDFIGPTRYNKSPFIKNNKFMFLDKMNTHNQTTIDDYVLKKYNESTYGTILPKVSLNNLNNDEETKTTQEKEQKNVKRTNNNVNRFYKIPFRKDLERVSSLSNTKTDQLIEELLPYKRDKESESNHIFKHLFIIKTKSKERINRKINSFKLNKFF